MKYFISLLFIAFLGNAHAQSFESVKDRTGKQLLKGFVTDSILLADTVNFSWFPDHQKAYSPAENIVKTFSENKNELRFMVFFGTWCTDSHYIIPRFYKIIEQSGIDKNKISLFALDRTKKDAAHFAENFAVAHVPTIIILQQGKELGRLVEYGTSGKFDEELAGIIKNIRKPATD